MAPLLVSDHLSEKSVLFFPLALPKEEIFFKLVCTLVTPDHTVALNSILEREKVGGTVIDSAVAIPHARLKGPKVIGLAIGVIGETLGDQPRLIFLFLSPKEDTKNHLLFLSSLSFLFQTEGFAEEILRSVAPYEVVQKIRQIEKGI